MDDARRFRGILRMGAVWGVALSAIATSSLAIGLATGLVPSSIFGARELIAVAIRGLAAGAVGGGLFGWLLSHREHSQLMANLSTRRVALWGFLAAGAVPAIVALTVTGPALPIGILATASLVAGVGGSVLGAGILRLARRSPERLATSADDPNRLLR